MEVPLTVAQSYQSELKQTLHLLHDVLHFVLLTVQDHPPLLLVLQVLEQRAVGLVLPLILQVPHVDGRHLPLPLCCCVQNNLQCRQAWGAKTKAELFRLCRTDLFPECFDTKAFRQVLETRDMTCLSLFVCTISVSLLSIYPKKSLQ